MLNLLRRFIISNLIIFSIPFASFAISAQDFDAEFLNSLPANIRNDVLDQAQTQIGEENIFQSRELEINKVEKSIEEIKKKLSLIEDNIPEDNDLTQGALIRFGEQFFNTFQSSFSVLESAVIDPDYILDAGDVLNINITGTQKSFSRDNKYSIQRDGGLSIPGLEKIFLRGLSLSQASDLIQKTLSEAYIGAKSYTSIQSMRDIKVLVLGHAENPGLYTVSGGSNILSLINAAGGITSQGSYRRITHKRNNLEIGNYDLYEMLIFGNLSTNTNLRSGDAIIVHPLLETVSISGGVGFPAIYEIKKNTNIEQALELAAGVLPGSSDEISLYRIDSDDPITAPLSELKNTILNNGDSIVLDFFNPTPNPIGSITLSGEVRKPGKYSIRQGDTLGSIIEAAGGYTENAYEYAGVLTRIKAKNLEKEFNQKIYNEMIKYLVTSGNVQQQVSIGSSTSLPLLLSEFKDIDPQGRISAEFSLSKLKENKELDILLADGDQIIIPAYTNEISVFGEVVTTGTRTFQEGLSPIDYINKSGGLNKYADGKRLIVIKPNGDSYLISSSLFSSLSSNNEYIEPGSIIYIPREIGKLDGINYASVIAPIISSIALSLASLNSIN